MSKSNTGKPKILSKNLFPVVGIGASAGGLEAFKKYGVFKGLWLTVRRISRCHPWGGHGYDPVP